MRAYPDIARIGPHSAQRQVRLVRTLFRTLDIRSAGQSYAFLKRFQPWQISIHSHPHDTWMGFTGKGAKIFQSQVQRATALYGAIESSHQVCDAVAGYPAKKQESEVKLFRCRPAYRAMGESLVQIALKRDEFRDEVRRRQNRNEEAFVVVHGCGLARDPDRSFTAAAGLRRLQTAGTIPRG